MPASTRARSVEAQARRVDAGSKMFTVYGLQLEIAVASGR